MRPTVPYVVYWNSIPSPYMVDRFNALVRRGNVEFEAWFNDRNVAERSWEINEQTWLFRYRYTPTVHILGLRLHLPVMVLGRRPDLLASLYAEPCYIFGWAVARMRGSRTCFRVLMTHDSWVTRNRFKNAIKRYLFERVDAIETVGEDGRRFAVQSGAPFERVFLATHTLAPRYFDEERLRALKAQSDTLRADFGLRGCVFIYVGRLWKGKGVNYLIDAFEALKREHAETSLLLVGDGPDEEEIRHRCHVRGIGDVVFAGFRQQEELLKFYAAADVFVFPTLGDPYGLVVDEAMACSLPIISTSAAGEIRDRVEDGVNGYIVPSEDSATLAARMLLIANDPTLRARMGHASAERIKGHTPEQWAEDFERIVQQLLERQH